MPIQDENGWITSSVIRFLLLLVRPMMLLMMLLMSITSSSIPFAAFIRTNSKPSQTGVQPPGLVAPITAVASIIFSLINSLLGTFLRSVLSCRRFLGLTTVQLKPSWTARPSQPRNAHRCVPSICRSLLGGNKSCPCFLSRHLNLGLPRRHWLALFRAVGLPVIVIMTRKTHKKMEALPLERADQIRRRKMLAKLRKIVSCRSWRRVCLCRSQHLRTFL